MAVRLATSSRVCTPEEAVAAIPDGACITVSGTITMLLPRTLLGALEARFLSDRAPAWTSRGSSRSRPASWGSSRSRIPVCSGV